MNTQSSNGWPPPSGGGVSNTEHGPAQQRQPGAFGYVEIQEQQTVPRKITPHRCSGDVVTDRYLPDPISRNLYTNQLHPKSTDQLF